MDRPKSITCLICAVLVFIVIAIVKISAPETSAKSTHYLRVYKVNKRVCDFPDKEDFSTPESAYAVINRVMARGEQGSWRRISVKSLSNIFPTNITGNINVTAEKSQMWLNARILEVRIFRGQGAVVLAEFRDNMDSPKIDKRFLSLENDCWLNKGQDPASATLEEARAEANVKFAHMLERPNRPKIKNPTVHLKSFVTFLKKKAENPKVFTMRALAQYKITIIGEIHHRPRYWAFNSSLVTEPHFPKDIGTIYLELPSNDQELVDTFLSSNKCDITPLVEMLRDNLWMGWPDQAMLDFFITVWLVNRELEAQEQLRIVLVDMQRPWRQIEKRHDFNKYNVNRDKYMAENIFKDLNEHPQEKRNALFIVGVGHAAMDFEYFEGAPVMTTGWYLREKIGRNNIYTIFPHRCVQTNMGRVNGRLCMGLFDSAFAAMDNKPMAFSLDNSPFGKESYDADPDRPVSNTYKDGFNAYLYLGPLETEIFSPLIAGFYTDEFVKEIERRHLLLYRKEWSEAYRQKETNAKVFIKWMRNTWGKPRREWQSHTLGPIDAWHRGGKTWKETVQNEKLAQVRGNHEEIIQAAVQLLENIRNADYEHFLSSTSPGWGKFPAAGSFYMTRTNRPKWCRWVCNTFKENPIVSIEVGEVFFGNKEIMDKKGWPTVPYKLTLKNGKKLEGNLPFSYTRGRWLGMMGLDWHLEN